MVSSLCLVSLTGIVTAQKDGYMLEDFTTVDIPIIDGKWSNSFEWSDAEERQLEGNLNAIFRLKYNQVFLGTAVDQQFFLIEFFDDTTADSADYLQICYATASQQGVPIGGTTPQTDCMRWDFVGHNQAGFKFYKGDGSAWVEDSGGKLGTAIVIADSYDTSPLSDTPHLIVEVMIAHSVYGIDSDLWIRVAAYDESNSAAGVQAWPAGSVDVPNDWGLTIVTGEAIPEFPSWIILPLVLTATLAIIIGRKTLIKSGS